jgi:hypothetical protein
MSKSEKFIRQRKKCKVEFSEGRVRRRYFTNNRRAACT